MVSSELRTRDFTNARWANNLSRYQGWRDSKRGRQSGATEHVVGLRGMWGREYWVGSTRHHNVPVSVHQRALVCTIGDWYGLCVDASDVCVCV